MVDGDEHRENILKTHFWKSIGIQELLEQCAIVGGVLELKVECVAYISVENEDANNDVEAAVEKRVVSQVCTNAQITMDKRCKPVRLVLLIAPDGTKLHFSVRNNRSIGMPVQKICILCDMKNVPLDMNIVISSNAFSEMPNFAIK